MCGSCQGCDRWYTASELVQYEIPRARFGTKACGNDDDTRSWSTLPMLSLEPRRVLVQEVTPKKKAATKSGCKKVNKIIDESDTEDDNVDKEMEEEEESDYDSESEADDLGNIEDEEDCAHETVEEIPEGFGYEDDEGYESDEKPTKKRRKY